jgi:hypothetical protein
MSLNISGSVVNSTLVKSIQTTNIIKRGLIADLDATSTDSYPGSGTGWYDLTGNLNNGVLTNGPTYSSSNGGYINFDGVDDYVSGLSTTFMNGASAGTFEFWMNTSNVAGGNGPYGSTGLYNILIGKASGPDNGLGLQSAAKVRLRLNSVNLDGNVTISTNTWYQIVGSWAPGSMKVYVNGNLDTSNTNTQTLESSTHYVQIGRMYLGNTAGSFIGKMSSAKVYNRQLTDAEVLQNYNIQKGKFGL